MSCCHLADHGGVCLWWPLLLAAAGGGGGPGQGMGGHGGLVPGQVEVEVVQHRDTNGISRHGGLPPGQVEVVEHGRQPRPLLAQLLLQPLHQPSLQPRLQRGHLRVLPQVTRVT